MSGLLGYLHRLEERPSEPTLRLTPAVEATRHELWRIKHPHHRDHAVRLLVWFPPDTNTVVVVLVGGDKTGIHDSWYTSAVVRRAEAQLDHLLRQRPKGTSDDN